MGISSLRATILSPYGTEEGLTGRGTDTPLHCGGRFSGDKEHPTKSICGSKGNRSEVRGQPQNI
ncbi:hypothetical protein EYF80_025114 [Liparis tanakae]|uniref:Uncharacterized protein n=1 Tax=Liparis tanakae TaxID=230148 RepID=A0A4Z2HFQ5_9TELE|nr:hypothetical protein EYF80_025114 [Liparis tanakae]